MVMVYQFADYWELYMYDVKKVGFFVIITIILLPILIYWGKHTTNMNWGKECGTAFALILLVETVSCVAAGKEMRMLDPLEQDRNETPIYETGIIQRVYYYKSDGEQPFTEYRARNYSVTITIDGIEYIVLQADTLHRGDEIELRYLPNSRCVLEWHYLDEQENPIDPMGENDINRE